MSLGKTISWNQIQVFCFFVLLMGAMTKIREQKQQLTSASELLLQQGSWGAVNLQVIIKAKTHRPLKITKITHI